MKEKPQRSPTTFSKLAHRFSQEHEVFNIESWLEQHGIEYEKRQKTLGTQYVVSCPWEHLHSGTGKADAAIFVHQNGAIGYNCFHSHCEGKGWQHYRAFYDGCDYGTTPIAHRVNNMLATTPEHQTITTETNSQTYALDTSMPSTIAPLPSNIDDGTIWTLCPQHLFLYLKQKNEAFAQLCEALDLGDPEDPEEPF